MALTLMVEQRISGTRLRITDGGGTEARSALFTTPVNIAQFTTDFSFQLTNLNRFHVYDSRHGTHGRRSRGRWFGLWS